MYVEVENVETPPDETVVWRYMNLERLLAMLTSGKLHLARLDGFKDTWEGTLPRKVAKAMNENLKRWGAFLQLSERFRSHLFASCWHESAYESAGLWEQYSASGFAIRSTIGRLKQAIQYERGYHIGRVRYRDFDNDYHGNHPPSIFTPAFLKRMNFEHEKEVRVVALEFFGARGLVASPDTLPGGLAVPVGLAELVDTLFLSPNSPPWLHEHVDLLLGRLDLAAVPVVQSTLYSGPPKRDA